MMSEVRGAEIQRLNQELERTNKQSEDREAEIQQLQDQNRDLQRQNQELEDKNKQLERNQTAANTQLQEERERRINAEREVERLKNQTEQSAETQSSTTGPIIVDQIDPQGKYIRLRNQSDKVQPLGGWELHLRVNKRKPNIWRFFYSDKVRAKSTVTIWVSEHGVGSWPLGDRVWKGLKSWSPEDHVLVTLFNRSGELKVSKEQRPENWTSQDSPSNRHITVDEVDQEGRYIKLYNNSSDQDQQLKDWSIYVEVDNRKPIMYTFGSLRLRAKNTVTIWASDCPTRNHSPTDLVWFGQKSWGPGNQQWSLSSAALDRKWTRGHLQPKHES
ncbi:lamin-L(II)-like protein [Lates japonicus]|uniref:Lamin-L(II)-like protein n=1 Tax=Lates japonicus TaxID=270547 RepID=A0AAD3RM38_LATJO|nr:lamin-L(II)-like protein [Lates japonicus]